MPIPAGPPGAWLHGTTDWLTHRVPGVKPGI